MRVFLFLSCVLLFKIYSMSQTKPFPYKKMWNKVDSLENKGLVKSALDVVLNINKAAKSENNASQVIKSYIYQVKYKNIIEEDAYEKLLQEMSKEAQNSVFPYSPLYNTLCAELYWQYYTVNRFRFFNRTFSDDEGDDIRSWSLKHLLDVIIKHHLKALEQKELLQKTPISAFNEILTESKNTENLRPTLYDFIAFRAVDFFSNKEITLAKPADSFNLNDSIYFCDAEKFIILNISTTDSLSLQYYGILILQDILRFRLKDKNVEAYIDADLKRLEFVYKNTSLQGKENFYLKALENIYQNVKENPYSNSVVYQIALTMKALSGKYNYHDSSTYKYKYYLAKALELAKNSIKKHPDALYNSYLENIISTIEEPSLTFNVEEAYLPNEPIVVNFNFKNVEKIYIHLRSIERNTYEELRNEYYDNQLIQKLYETSKPLFQKTIVIPSIKDYLNHSTEDILGGVPSGFYILFASNNPDVLNKQAIRCIQKFFVTNIVIVSTQNDDGSYKLIITDRKNGNPIVNATITEYWLEYGQSKNKLIKGQSYLTDNNGTANILLPDNPYRKKQFGNVLIEVKTNTETFLSEKYYYVSPHYSYRDDKTYSTTIFTDRAIYRPGQIVYYKGLVLQKEKNIVSIVSNNNVTVVLRDANNQIVEEQLKTTNEFGTFSGSFVLPEGLLNGIFSIQTNFGSCTFRVEEYKRPRFFVEAEAIDKEYYLNDTVVIKTLIKSYAGVPLQNVTVKYRITRIPKFRNYWYIYRQLADAEIANGTIQSDENGIAYIKFKAISDNNYPLNEHTFYNFKVQIDATDINQETQSTECIVSAGTVGLFFDVVLKEIVNVNELTNVSFSVKNANGKKLNSKGTYNLYKLEDLKTPLRNRLWPEPDVFLYSKSEWEKLYKGNVYDKNITIRDLRQVEKVYTGFFNSQYDSLLNLSGAITLQPGSYLLEMISTDSRGKEVKHKHYFTAYYEGFSNIPNNEALFIVCKNQNVTVGNKAKFILASAYNDVKVFMMISHLNSSGENKWIELKNQQQNVIEIAVQEKHRGNIHINFFTIIQNRIYQKEFTIFVPYDNKELLIKTETFRSKIYPGSKEKWKFVISGKNGEKVFSELLASMYDKSLDAFVNHSWNFSPYMFYHHYKWVSAEMFSFTYSNCYNLSYNIPSYPEIKYPQLNLFGLYYYGVYKRHRNGGGVYTAKKQKIMKDEVAGVAEELPTMAFAQKPGNKKEEQTRAENTNNYIETTKPNIRTNLNETAFFYPELRTNEKGEVEFTFQSPEALTTWKFMAFAHSKDLKYGFYQNECITQKEIMITAQLPRFFREGDSLDIYIKVDNLSASTQNLKVSIKIEDIVTNEKALLFISEKNISVKPNSSEAIYFTYVVPYGLTMAKVTSIAKSKNFSDGEETILPVLPNRMMVTESLPFYVRGKQNKKVDFKRLEETLESKTISPHSVTLEYTSNPIWYAIMAIPYLSTYPYECNEQLFNRYYAGILSKYIVSSIPNFKQIFDNWLNDSLYKPLKSPLTKNDDLKNVTIAETPWVQESISEQEQRMNIAKYFDEKNIQKELNDAASKLLKNQYPNGAWGWFAGMPENRYITQYIVASNGRLERAYNIDTRLTKAIDKAIQYIDKELEKDYYKLIANTKKEELLNYVPNPFYIQYLYARSFYLNKNKNFLQSDAYGFFYNQAKKNWIYQTEYMQGMIALILYRNNEKELAQDVINSLKERCVVSEEQGMYWKSISQRGVYWNEASIEAHSLLIEAFYEITNDIKTVNELKLWLLLQKQTQNWKTTVATADAIYSLLFNGKTEVETTFDAAIMWAEKPLAISKQTVEQATGYIKTTVSSKEINPLHSKIEIHNKGESISWGAIHWQYFENIDKISTYNSKYMSIKREYFLEKITSSGKVLQSLNHKTTLKTGDVVVVRLVIECDRNLEFVHIKDMRPSSFEPIQVLSGYNYKDGLGFYAEVKDASYNIFIDRINRGKYVLEYPLRVSQKGKFSTGITSIQCMYAPEFNAHDKGLNIQVK